MSAVPYESPWANDELRMFRATVRQFIQKEFVPHQARWREQQRPDVEAWTQAGRAGVLLPDLPEAYGGGGGTFAHAAVVLEELAHAGVHFGSGIQSIVAHYILAYGSEEQKCGWLPLMARGELVAAIAMSEPGAGSDLRSIQTTARRDGDQYVINGSKTFITNGALAGLVCLAVKTDPRASGVKGISLIVVETKGLRGYRVGGSLDKIGMHGQDTCELFFDESRVPATNLLGGVEGKGFYQMMERLPYERLGVAVVAVATAEQAVAITTDYVKQRTAFGKPLMELQNTRFKLAECKTAAHVGRVFVDHCIERFIAGELDGTTAAMAQYWLSDCQCRIVDAGVQLHGGSGYMTEYPIARLCADSRAHALSGGGKRITK